MPTDELEVLEQRIEAARRAGDMSAVIRLAAEHERLTKKRRQTERLMRKPWARA